MLAAILASATSGTLAVLCAVALAGCGSLPESELPPAAAIPDAPPQASPPAGRLVDAPAPPERSLRVAVDKGRQVGVLSVRARVLELFDARTRRSTGSAFAGAGPVDVASDGGNYLYVTDAITNGVLVFRIVPELTLVRRYSLRGGPYAIAYDAQRRRLWVTLAGANRLAELTAGRRIRLLRSYAALRQPATVDVDEVSGAISVTGRQGGVVQVLEP